MTDLRVVMGEERLLSEKEKTSVSSTCSGLNCITKLPMDCLLFAASARGQ